MDFSEIENNVKRLKDEISAGNAYGEAVTLVAATKTQSAEAINAAIRAGVDAVAENKVRSLGKNLRRCTVVRSILSGICRRIK
ncbi:MAG: hypothetical protein ACLS4Z_10070 [Christensenellaceae bacterium]